MQPNNPENDSPGKSPLKTWLRRRSVLKATGISASTFKRYCKRKLIEKYQPIPGGKYLYDAEQVNEMIRSKKID